MVDVVLRSEYSTDASNNVYKDAETVVLMGKEEVEEEKKWRVTRVYKGMFSCEEAIRRLLEVHVDTEEEL